MSYTEGMNQAVLVKDMVRTLKKPANLFAKPVVVTYVAVPASGKSTMTEQILRSLPFTAFSLEQIQSYLMPATSIFSDNQAVLNFSVDVIKELVRQKRSVIFDTSVDKIADRKRLRAEVEAGGGQLLLVHLKCEDDLIFRRIQLANIKVAAGEKKGFILDRDYFQFKKSQIQIPYSESAFEMDCQDDYAFMRLTSLLESKLGAPLSQGG